MAEEKVYLGKDQLALVWQLIKNAFVAKVDGKGLSTNDFTDALRDKLAGMSTVTSSSTNGAIKINGADEVIYVLPAATATTLGGVIAGSGLSVDAAGKLANAITKLSQLENDKGYITADDVPDTFELPVATTDRLGGVKSGLIITVAADGTLGIAQADASSAGVVKLYSELADKTDGVLTLAALNTIVTNLQSGINAKQSPETSLAGYGITDAYTKEEVDSMVSAALSYKGTKTNYSDLPTTGNKVGDVWNIENADDTHGVRAGDNVAWNGSGWDVLAGAIDLSGYVQDSSIRAMTETEINAICV